MLNIINNSNTLNTNDSIKSSKSYINNSSNNSSNNSKNSKNSNNSNNNKSTINNIFEKSERYSTSDMSNGINKEISSSDSVSSSVSSSSSVNSSVRSDIRKIGGSREENIYIKYDIDEKKFKFKNSGGKMLGYFSVEDVIMYIGSFYDSKGELSNIALSENKINLIRKYICIINFNNKINYAKIKLHDHTTSSFMGDIEMLMRFNKDLELFSKNNIGSLLNNVEIENREDIKAIIDKFMIGILNYTISLISQLSRSKELTIRDKLVKYSIGLTYRLTAIINDKINHLENRQDALYDIVNKSIILKKNIEKKICDLSASINNNIEDMENINNDLSQESISSVVDELFNN